MQICICYVIALILIFVAKLLFGIPLESTLPILLASMILVLGMIWVVVFPLYAGLYLYIHWQDEQDTKRFQRKGPTFFGPNKNQKTEANWTV